MPELWDAAPKHVLRLLSGSRCTPVLEFAVKAFQAIPDKEQHYTPELAGKLCRHPFEVISTLGLEMARQLLADGRGSAELLLGLLHSLVEAARTLAFSELTANAATFMADGDFVAGLLTSTNEEIRSWSQRWLAQPAFDAALQAKALQALLTHMHGWRAHAEDANDPMLAHAQTVLALANELLAAAIPAMSIDEVLKMLEHPMDALKVQAARWLLVDCRLSKSP